MILSRLVSWALRHRVGVCILVSLLTLISAVTFFKNFDRADNSLPVWFEKNDPAFQEYQQFLKEFGSDRTVLVAFEVPDALSPPVLDFLSRLSFSLQKIPDIDRVISLPSLQTLMAVDDSLELKPIVDPLNREATWQAVMGHPQGKGVTVSEDGRVAALIAEVSTKHQYSESRALVQAIEEAIQVENRSTYPVHLVGSPVMDAEFNRLVVRDQRVFFPATVIITIFLLALFFRNGAMALIPTAVQVCLIFWILALYYALDFELNIIGGMAAPILVVVSIINSVHLIRGYAEERKKGLEKEEALCRSVILLAKPCLYTALTTVVGFLAFSGSAIPPLQLMGLLTAVGVMLSLGLTLILIPVVISFLPDRYLSLHEPREERLSGILTSIARFGITHPRKILMVFAALTLIAIIGATRLHTETNFFEYFFEDARVRQDLDFIEKGLTGTGSYEIILQGRNNQSLATDPTFIQSLMDFKQLLLQISPTQKATSVDDLYKNLSFAFALPKGIPQDPTALSQFLLLTDSADFPEATRYRTPNNEKVRIAVTTQWLSSEEMEKYFTSVRQLAGSFFKEDVKVSLTGFGPLWVKLDHDLFMSQVQSIIISLILVSALMMFFLKSLKLGLISLVPNILPILFTMGLMGLCGWHLNVVTVMIASVSLGITVDDTIHYLSRYRIHLKEKGSNEESILATHGSIGVSIFYSAFILMGGFGVLAFGSFMPTVSFGSMVALTFLVGVVCEIVLMPACLYYTSITSPKDQISSS